MKRRASCLLALILAVSMLFGGVASAKVYKILDANGEGSDTQIAVAALIAGYQEINPEFQVEIETIPNHDQYYQKQRTYVAGNKIPDMMCIAGNTYDAMLAQNGLIVDLKPYLEEIGQYDKIFPAAVGYQSFKDGFMFALPQSLSGEAFWYWKEDFEKAGVEPPKTFDEFLAACESLKGAGYTPISVSGKETWQLLRYLSFMPWRITGREFIDVFKKGQASFGDVGGKQAADFLYALGQKGYLDPSVSTVDYTAAREYFLAHKASIFYIGTWEGAVLAPLYEEGKIGYFALPEVTGFENKGCDTYAHSGFGFGFSTAGWDDNMKGFVKYFCENYGKELVKAGVLSPFTDDDISTLPQLLKDFAATIAELPENALVWDVALDPTTNMEMGRNAVELVLGAITPDQFIERIDKVAAENAPKFFTEDLSDMF